MLALSHHVIVQVAAMRVGKPNFDLYALLGDDIVIADKAVAESYHYIMTVILGVDINLSKSLIGKHTFEFAKQIFHKGENLSPLGPKNLLVAMRTRGGISSLFLDMVNKDFMIDEERLNMMFTNNVPTLSNKARDLVK